MKVFTTLLFLAAIHLSAAAQQHSTLRVLFIGNSYIYVNNLPQLVYNVALAHGDTLIFDSNAIGGYTFSGHASNAVTQDKIQSQAWDYVVLQAQSQEPSFSPEQVDAQTTPFALQLDAMVDASDSCALTVFFETWGRKNGDSANCGFYPPVCTYAGMQDRLLASYSMFAEQCQAIMAPVGEAWRMLIGQNATLELYQADQSHPSVAGSYLAACVFYETLFRKSVLETTYTAGLDPAVAAELQQVAHAIVSGNLQQWNIGTTDRCLVASVNDESKADDWKLYPNPACHTLSVQRTAGMSSNDAFRIFNAQGQVCMKGTLSHTQLDITALPNGVYWLAITTSKGEMVKRFVKE